MAPLSFQSKGRRWNTKFTRSLAGDASAENEAGSVGPLLPSETPTWKVRLHAACGLSRRTFGAGSPIPPIPAYTPVCLPLLPQAPLLMCRWG